MLMVRDAGFTTKPAIIGHSMGGMVNLMTSHLFPNELAALMMCDYYVRPPHAHEEWYMETTKTALCGHAKHVQPVSIKISRRRWRAFDCSQSSLAQTNSLSIILANILSMKLMAAGHGSSTRICIVTSLWAKTGRKYIKTYRCLALPCLASCHMIGRTLRAMKLSTS